MKFMSIRSIERQECLPSLSTHLLFPMIQISRISHLVLASLWMSVCLMKSSFFNNYFLNFSIFFYYQKSWSMKNTFQSKKNLVWFSGKCFPFISGGKHFPEVVKNLEMSYYLLIILNLIIKLLIAIYIFCFGIFFSISSLRI